jgi:formylglycine-generating enzyme required for sulfatase activity
MADMLPPPFDWCFIPAGTFEYSLNVLDEVSEAARPDPKRYLRTISYDFYFSKYPVTNAQYAKFIEADGYNTRAYWTKAGWKLNRENAWTEPERWHDVDYNQPKQPVVGISWYEGYAFTQWLGSQLGANIRLPIEAEWEYVARMPPKSGSSYPTNYRRFPWGNAWDADKCHNSVETRKEYPAEVDTYPDGASGYGVVDMVGNVLEMCMDASSNSTAPEDKDVFTIPAHRYSRRVRGSGFWLSNPSTFESDRRDGMTPDSRTDRVGLRLMRYAPDSK